MKFEVLVESLAENQRAEVSEEPDIREASLPYEGAAFLRVSGHCRRCNATPLEVQGDRRSKLEKEGITYCLAYCIHCRQPVGTLKLIPQTLWGVQEDARALGGPWKVY